jgi:hypothetical protein
MAPGIAQTSVAFAVTGWSEPVPGREFRPLSPAPFHWALFRQLSTSHRGRRRISLGPPMTRAQIQVVSDSEGHKHAPYGHASFQVVAKRPGGPRSGNITRIDGYDKPNISRRNRLCNDGREGRHDIGTPLRFQCPEKNRRHRNKRKGPQQPVFPHVGPSARIPHANAVRGCKFIQKE